MTLQIIIPDWLKIASSNMKFRDSWQESGFTFISFHVVISHSQLELTLSLPTFLKGNMVQRLCEIYWRRSCAIRTWLGQCADEKPFVDWSRMRSTRWERAASGERLFLNIERICIIYHTSVIVASENCINFLFGVQLGGKLGVVKQKAEMFWVRETVG